MSAVKDNDSTKFPHMIPDETLEHFHKARDEMRKGFESLFPKEFVDRRRAARREMLMGIRSMIDHVLEETDKKHTA